MAASNNLNYTQLAMFMPAHALKQNDRILPGDYQNTTDYHPETGRPTNWRDETGDEVWSRKSEEAAERGLTDEIAAVGIHTPIALSHDDYSFEKMAGRRINISHGTIVNGHHRIAAAHDLDPNTEVPVTYRTDRRKFGSFSSSD